MDSQITVALAGNPNCGKTTIFNYLTGARQHVGNYPGITVEKKDGMARCDGQDVRVIDLPGTYSLTAYSQEEVVARRTLAEERPDVVIQVADAGALERNLYLTVQLMELGIPVVLALNMMDEVHRRGDSIDSARLAATMGIPVVECTGRSGLGLDTLLRTAVALAAEVRGKEWNPLKISYGTDIDPVVDEMTALIVQEFAETSSGASASSYPPRWLALKFLEGDGDVREASFISEDLRNALDALLDKTAKHLDLTLQTYPEAVIADFRYGYITSVLRGDIVTRHKESAGRRSFSDKLDQVLTHTLLGPLIMLGIFYLVYKVAFEFGAYPMDVVDAFFGWLGDMVDANMSDGLLKSMVVSGVIAGVGGVMVFVPLILVMFLLIAFLEDSGYMARAAYMLDRVFRVFGLHGSSVMPYVISGGIAGGCAVPGVMATRTLRSPKEKLATMLTLPFMTCGAKIPVFILFVGVFFAAEHQPTVMLCLTLTGWALALLSAWVLRHTVIKGDPTPFVMELPPYRLPTLRGLLLHTWERGWQYIKKAGTIILAISILIWALMTFPTLPADVAERHDVVIAQLEEKVGAAEESVLAAGGSIEAPEEDEDAEKLPEELLLAEARDALAEAENIKSAETLRNSIAGRIGTALEPVSRYAGFEWRTNIALLGGFAAKEVLVSSLGTAYSLGEVDPEEAESLAEKIKADTGTWSMANALSLMIFVLVYAPCVVTIAAIRREANSWGWALFSLVFSTALAYVLAVGVYQIGKAVL
ncbi:ferrous iron transport protein B [Desulfovibrio sp. OttesenSCG-928-I05]|nr:ferrous iron transport protein B [Desulfovibrio sp. OttesenSCG-928-I05]